MICSSRQKSKSPGAAEADPRFTGRPTQTPGLSPYGRPFWRAYLSNMAVMVAIALLFRYADFVTLLGGTELHLGWIVGVGAVGSLLMRASLGTAIDHYGPRLVWVGSLIVFAASCFAHLAVAECHGPAIYLLRVAFASAIAGTMGAAMTFISGRAPVERMAEMIGMLGTSGFVGIVLGTQLGDCLLGTDTIQRWQVDRMFLVAGTLGLSAALFAWAATRHQVRPVRRRRPPSWWLFRRYHPGTVLLVGAAMGIGIALPTTFLRTYAAELSIPRIGLFFGVYAPTAILTRILTRRLPERFGLRPMILIGLGTLTVGQVLLIFVSSEWTFIAPGIVYGAGHAILVPATLAAGSRAFPNRYRGLGTTLIMATFDVGNLVGAPMAGAILHFSGKVGLPRYPTMFLSMAAMITLAGLVYAFAGRRSRWPPRTRLPGHTPLARQVETPRPVEVGTDAHPRPRAGAPTDTGASAG
jgi:MFS family permease